MLCCMPLHPCHCVASHLCLLAVSCFLYKPTSTTDALSVSNMHFGMYSLQLALPFAHWPLALHVQAAVCNVTHCSEQGWFAMISTLCKQYSTQTLSAVRLKDRSNTVNCQLPSEVVCRLFTWRTSLQDAQGVQHPTMLYRLKCKQP